MEEWLAELKGEKEKGVLWDFLNVIGVVLGLFIAQIIGNSLIMQLMGSQPRIYRYLPLILGGNLLLNAIVLIGWIYLSIKVIEKRSLASIGLLSGKGTIKNYFKGALMGMVMVGITIMIIALGGGMSFEWRGIDRSQYLSFGLIVLAWIVLSSSEEMLIRGYLLSRLGVRRGCAVGIMVSSICYSLLHSLNIGSNWIAIVNIGLMSIFLGVYVLRTGNLWRACGWHTAWNLVQGNILGLNVSGNQMGVAGEVWRGKMMSKNALLTGGDFGIEASLATTLIMLAAIVFNLFISTDQFEDESIC